MARIVGKSNVLTRNKVVLDPAHWASVNCGADILLSGLYQDVKGEAECPSCGARIEIVIKSMKIASVIPQSAILHYVVEDESRFSICCSPTIIFDKESCLGDWLKTYRGKQGKISSLPEFIDQAALRRKNLTT
jgi:hypothetical protein